MPYDDKPFSAACERNKQPILEQLQRLIGGSDDGRLTLLEIGAGTGQHAVHCAAAMPQVNWVATDCAENLPGINRWIDEAGLSNLGPAIELDALQPIWPELTVHHVFSANTAHIMPWTAVEAMFTQVTALLPPNGKFMLYGPFNYNGAFTSDGNQSLDAWARQTFAGGGLRDFDDIVRLASTVDLQLLEDVPMPANNRLLVFGFVRSAD